MRLQQAALPPQRLIAALLRRKCAKKPLPMVHTTSETLYEPDMGTELEDQDFLLVFAASADPASIYLHEAMKQPDKAQFKQAMNEEVESRLMQTTIGNYFTAPSSCKESLFYLPYGR